MIEFKQKLGVRLEHMLRNIREEMLLMREMIAELKSLKLLITYVIVLCPTN